MREFKSHTLQISFLFVISSGRALRVWRWCSFQSDFFNAVSHSCQKERRNATLTELLDSLAQGSGLRDLSLQGFLFCSLLIFGTSNVGCLLQIKSNKGCEKNVLDETPLHLCMVPNHRCCCLRFVEFQHK